MKKRSGFATFEIMLGVFLLAGVLILIMQTLNTHKKFVSSEQMGIQLSTLVNTLFENDQVITDDSESLIENTSHCSNSDGYISSFGDAYLESLGEAGVDICNAKISVTST